MKPKRNRFEGRASQASLTGLKAVAAAPQVLAPAELPLASIRPNRHQPRRHFDEVALQELAASIKARGVLQPIRVRRDGEFFEIIGGERRFRAAQMAGLTSIPATVETREDYSELDQAIDALVENLQRDDLSVVDEVEGVFQLVRMRAEIELGDELAGGLDYQAVEQAFTRMRNAGQGPFRGIERIIDEVATELGFSWKTMAIKKVSVWRWPPEVVQALREQAISLEVARVLQRITNGEERAKWLERSMAEGLSAAALRSLMRAEERVEKPDVRRRAPELRRRLNRALKQLEAIEGKRVNQSVIAQVERLERFIEELEAYFPPS